MFTVKALYFGYLKNVFPSILSAGCAVDHTSSIFQVTFRTSPVSTLSPGGLIPTIYLTLWRKDFYSGHSSVANPISIEYSVNSHPEKGS